MDKGKGRGSDPCRVVFCVSWSLLEQVSEPGPLGLRSREGIPVPCALVMGSGTLYPSSLPLRDSGTLSSSWSRVTEGGWS
jgi:hypothetical protein